MFAINRTRKRFVMLVAALVISFMPFSLFASDAYASESCILQYSQDAIDKIGKQSNGDGMCLAYCYAYAESMVSGKVLSASSFWNGNRAKDNSRFTPIKKGDAQSTLKLAYDSVKAGKPCILHLKEKGGGQHWVLIVGYQNVSDSSKLSLKNFLMLDPRSNVSKSAVSLDSRGDVLKFGDSRGNVRVCKNTVSVSKNGSTQSSQPAKASMYSGNRTTSVPEGIEFTIRPRSAKNKVLDVSGGYGKEGVNLQLYERNGTPAQTFQFVSTGNGTYAILNWSGDYGVLVGLSDWNRADQVNVAMRYYCPNWDINKWYVEATPDGFYSFRNVYSGRYLEVTNSNYANGANIQQYKGYGVDAQKFVIEYMPRSGNTVVSSGSLDGKAFVIESSGNKDMVLDVAGGSGAHGVNLQLYGSNGTAAQKFVFHANGDGTYCISNWSGNQGRLGVLIGLYDWCRTDGANIQLNHNCPNWETNRWYIEKTPDGYYSFRNLCSTLYLDVSNGRFTNGNNIWQIPGNGTAAQKFNLIPVEES